VAIALPPQEWAGAPGARAGGKVKIFQKIHSNTCTSQASAKLLVSALSEPAGADTAGGGAAHP
jgi:hypothetical protein